MKTKKKNDEKKFQKANPLPRYGDFEKMAEMMKICCPGEEATFDCCSMMTRMMGHGEDAETKKTNETQEQVKRTKNG